MYIPEKIKQYVGQGENPDLSFLVSQFDQKLDQEFGITYEVQEKLINATGEELYRDHNHEALLTSYLDYHQIFLDMGPNKTLIDLGAGYCRGSLLALDPQYKVRCLSYELAKSRIEGALKHSHDIFNQDITDENFVLPKCEALFLYMPTGKILNSILKKIIKSTLENCVLYVIESHGDFVDNLRFYSDFLVEMDSELKVSTQRHASKIYKFKLTNLDLAKNMLTTVKRNDFSNLALLPYWILSYSHFDIKCRVQSKVIGQEEPRFWEASLKNATLIRYNGEFSLQLQKPFRILQLETQDSIHEK
jgi:hypothetical protein